MWAWDREVVQVTLKQTPASNPARPRHPPHTDPDGGLGRGRLNLARLSSKNSTSRMTASYNRPHAEGGPGLWGRKTVTERSEGETGFSAGDGAREAGSGQFLWPQDSQDSPEPGLNVVPLPPGRG